MPCVALASGTAAMHLGLRALGVGADDEVFVSTLTFIASVNPIGYLCARPVFIDSEYASWNMDPDLLAEALSQRARSGRLPSAVVVVHLYGQTADMDPICDVCARHGVPVLEDAAEALGSTYKGRSAGTIGDVGVYSFNGNKIITTTSGGMLVSRSSAMVEKARYWSTQAREPGVAYQHVEVGYNYRMSNVLAGIGRGQWRVLAQRVRQRREVAFRYKDAFGDLDGLELMPQAEYGVHTNWLSCFLVDEARLGVSRDDLIRALHEENIESRPVWKPMHLQPVLRNAEVVGGRVAEDLFARGICLPSSSSLSEFEQERVIGTIRNAVRAKRLS